MTPQRSGNRLDRRPDCELIHEFESTTPGTVQHIDVAHVDLGHQIADEAEILKLPLVELPRTDELVIWYPPKSVALLSGDPGEPYRNLDLGPLARLFASRFVGPIESDAVNVYMVDRCPLPQGGERLTRSPEPCLAQPRFFPVGSSWGLPISPEEFSASSRSAVRSSTLCLAILCAVNVGNSGIEFLIDLRIAAPAGPIFTIVRIRAARSGGIWRPPVE